MQALSSGAEAGPRGPFVFRKEIEIRWRDLDGYAHVNHAVYVDLPGGGPGRVADQHACGTVRPAGTTSWCTSTIDYRRQLTQADDVVVASCEAAELGTSSVTTREELRTQGGRPGGRGQRRRGRPRSGHRALAPPHRPRACAASFRRGLSVGP